MRRVLRHQCGYAVSGPGVGSMPAAATPSSCSTRLPKPIIAEPALHCPFAEGVRFTPPTCGTEPRGRPDPACQLAHSHTGLLRGVMPQQSPPRPWRPRPAAPLLALLAGASMLATVTGTPTALAGIRTIRSRSTASHPVVDGLTAVWTYTADVAGDHAIETCESDATLWTTAVVYLGEDYHSQDPGRRRRPVEFAVDPVQCGQRPAVRARADRGGAGAGEEGSGGGRSREDGIGTFRPDSRHFD